MTYGYSLLKSFVIIIVYAKTICFQKYDSVTIKDS